MSVLLNPYIHFKDNTRQAMEFYQTVFGGSLDLNTFGETQMPHDPSEDDKIMHAQLNGDNGIVFMASDTPASMSYEAGQTITMSLSGDDEARLQGYWDRLAEGGQVAMPLTKAEWGDTFGMLTDKFGIEWMVNISGSVSDGAD